MIFLDPPSMVHKEKRGTETRLLVLCAKGSFYFRKGKKGNPKAASKRKSFEERLLEHLRVRVPTPPPPLV